MLVDDAGPSEVPARDRVLTSSRMTNTQPKSNVDSASPRKPWRAIVLEALIPLAREHMQVPLAAIYDAVERQPDTSARMATNGNVRPKVRQVLQRLCDDGVISRDDVGVYGLPPNLSVNA